MVTLSFDAASGRTVRGYAETEDFQILAMPEDTLVSASWSGAMTIADVVCDVSADAMLDHVYRVGISVLLGGSDAGVTLASLDTGVGVIESGLIRRVADGVCRVAATSTRGSRMVALPLSRTGGNTVRGQYIAHAAGSAALAIDNAIAAAINGKSPGSAAQRLFTDAGARNPGFYLAAYDWSGVNVWVDDTGNTGPHACTLVSPIHGICANHYIPLGKDIVWLDRSGAAQSRRIAGTRQIGNTDIAVVILDQEVANCQTYAIGPADIASLLPSPQLNVTAVHTGIPSGGAGTATNGLTKMALPVQIAWTGGADKNVYARRPALDSLILWYVELWHSGSPLFAPLAGNLVLLCCWWARNGFSDPINNNVFGPYLGYYVGEINAAMAALTAAHDPGGPNYQLSVADFSAYNAY